MGLDNGFILKGKINKNSLPKVIKDRLHDWNDNETDVDVIYWRKCYSMRYDVLYILGFPNEEYYYDVTLDKIPDIIEALSQYLDIEYWNEHADCIWDYDVMAETLYYDILVLNWMYFFLKENPDRKFVFYDSY